MASPTSAAADRIGVVIRVPEPRAERLRTVRRQAGDPLAALEPHLTLVTGVQVGDWAAALEHVRSVAAATAPFNLLVQGAGTFRPVTPVVYAAVVEGVDECMQLHVALQSGPLEASSEYPYVPHVTLAQHVDDAALDAAALSHSLERWWLFADSLSVYAAPADATPEEWELLETVALGG
ncbi:MAG: 2'-5' RNA ligase family protein [Galactobacter sp.]|uniref:2'-5' RNA ligase family protein n=1 Tax=Galactobacter sp. TaxID=2676125 RepID=UPI0025BD5F3F|nr:2'-5' RNA ligase family protein [Galactobacter sp.]